jgi:hypothetical protein
LVAIQVLHRTSPRTATPTSGNGTPACVHRPQPSSKLSIDEFGLEKQLKFQLIHAICD